MKNHAEIRQRFLQDDLPHKLGALAANLARIKSFSDHPAHGEVVADLLSESMYFIEWAAAEADVENQPRMLELQRLLFRWHRAWARNWADELARGRIATQAGHWSEQVLRMSGLLQ